MDVLNRLKSAVTNVLPGNPLSGDFNIQAQIASCGPGLLWKVFSATKKSTKEEASVFLFEKKSIEKYNRKDRELVIERLKRGVQQLTKLRHPRILSVIHPLEETREALAFATEPVFASLSNVLGCYDNIHGTPKFLEDFHLYEVEIKHGLLQVLEGLAFLHNSAKMMHGNMCPTSIILTKTGTWKLSGMEWVIQASNPQEHNAVYPCEDWRSGLPLEAQANLDYRAPEYELTHVCSPASDMYSFGILLYAIYNKGKPLFECYGEIRTFRKNAEELSSVRGTLLQCIPAEIADHVKLLINIEPTVRPDAAQMSKIPYFEDMACMALQYLDTLYQRENIEKSNFFKGLPKIVERLPKRVSQQRVLPALFKEGATPNMVPFILPAIFLISEQSTTEEYRELVLPNIIPFLKLREPVQVMLMFLQNMNLLLSKTPTQQLQTYVFPLIFSALESDSPQIQELCLNIIPGFADLIEYTTLKKSLVPRIKKLCLCTSVLNVRVNCLLCIGKLMDQMDKWYVLDEILPFLREIPTREPAVLMSILGIHKVALSEAKLGITKDMMANKVLPFLIPLAIDNNLNLKQFNAYMSVIKEMLSKVEIEHRTKLEQLDQIQQEHKTLEIGHVGGDHASHNFVDDKSSFMDKFMSGMGLGPAGTSTPSSSAQPSTQPPGVAAASPNVDGSSALQKKTHLTLEEKQRLAKQQEQERALKTQKPLVPQGKTTQTMNGATKTPTTNKTTTGPRDLTATLMESNMRNLSMNTTPAASRPGNMTMTPLSSGMQAGSTGVNWPQSSTGMGIGSSVNWGSSSQSSQFMAPQSSFPSSTMAAPPPSSMSTSSKPAVDLSAFDSIMTTGATKKPALNQLGQSGSGGFPRLPGAMGMNSSPAMGMGGNSSQPMGWGAMGSTGGFQSPTQSGGMGGMGQPMMGGGTGWGGMSPQPTMMGNSAMMKPNQGNSNVKNTSGLSQADINDLLG